MLKWVHIFDFDVNKGLGFKVNDHVKISKYKHIFAKGYALNWSDKVFVTKTAKTIVLWTYVIEDLNPNKAGLFKSSYFWRGGGGVSLTPPPPPIFQKPQGLTPLPNRFKVNGEGIVVTFYEIEL